MRTLSAFAVLACLPAASQTLPPRGQIAELMRRVNAWQVANPVFPPENRNWERATWYTGVMAAWKATGDERFLKQALEWGRQHGWQVETKEKAGADKIFCSQTWLELYLLHKKDKAMTAPTIAWLETADPHSPGGDKQWYQWSHGPYVDSLYAAPLFAMLYRATGERKYLELLHPFFRHVTAELFDEQEALYYRDRRFTGQKTPSGRKVLWSRGNGWAIGGLVRVLEYLPKSDPERPRYAALLGRMGESLARCQGEDGLWRTNLADADQASGPETSGSGFFCYALAWGVRNKVLPRARYMPVVERAWAGLSSAVAPDGKVRWGQKVADRPDVVPQESTQEYVSGTFLLAASEAYRLSRQR